VAGIKSGKVDTEIREVSDALFDIIDQDHDGRVTEAEVYTSYIFIYIYVYVYVYVYVYIYIYEQIIYGGDTHPDGCQCTALASTWVSVIDVEEIVTAVLYTPFIVPCFCEHLLLIYLCTPPYIYLPNDTNFEEKEHEKPRNSGVRPLNCAYIYT